MPSSTASRGTVPVAQEKVLVARSGNRCAYPSCGVELVVEAHHQDDRPKAVGKVAHIAAASAGGPRFDPDMTPQQRGSARNLIYLCGTHHDAIDSQLALHTRAFLVEAKTAHERLVANAMRRAMGDVTYKELNLVCQVIVHNVEAISIESTDLPLPVEEKIVLNALGEATTERITEGLAQAYRVADFIAFQNKYDSKFGRSLVARMKADYFTALSEGLAPDEVFDYIVEVANENAGIRDTEVTRAAAVAVVAHVFELCEIFERA